VSLAPGDLESTADRGRMGSGADPIRSRLHSHQAAVDWASGRPIEFRSPSSESVQTMRKLNDTKSTRLRSQSAISGARIRCVDLFCGAGGLTFGLRKAGVEVVAGVDFDPACEFAYGANNPGARFHRRDITEVASEEVAAWFGDLSCVRVLAGCAPCQPFSSYSQRYETVGTPRWGLLSEFGRLVEAIQPDIVTMENVPTIGKHEVFRAFVRVLESKKYHVWLGVVDSAKFGLPQRRRRTVLLASRFGGIELEPPVKGPTPTVRDAIKDLPRLQHGKTDPQDPLHTASRLSPLNLRRIKASKAGGSWKDWPAELVAPCHRRSTGKSYPGVYGRMTWDAPSPTLTTQFFGFGSGRFGHPSQARAISLREGALLQGFPRSYRFVPEGQPVQMKTLGRLIGNAVPVTLGEAIGRSIVRHVRAQAIR
jgi:DNA (cytosine-5)-methyltransferase 1